MHCLQSRDGRITLHLSAAATLSKWKVIFLAVGVFVIAAYTLAPVFGVESPYALRRRVRDLEERLSRRIYWVVKHRQHLKDHMQGGWTPTRHSDGRKHLLSPPDGISRIAEALAVDGKTAIADFDDHYLCGDNEVKEGDMITKKVALAAVTWYAPKSLRNSMETWASGGLLDVMDEKMIFINSSPSKAEDETIAREFDFDIYTTEEHGGNIMAGPSIAYLVGNATADYILFMEKDFVLSSDRDTMLREMYVGMQHLARGVDVYRYVHCCLDQCPHKAAILRYAGCVA